MLQLTKPLAFIDLETTGVNLGTDRIIEIAIVKVLTDGNRSVKRKLINPGISIPKASSDVHGITDEMVKDAPFFKQVAQELKQFLDGCDLAGYNSNRFDIPLLVEEFLRAEVEFEIEGQKNARCPTDFLQNGTSYFICGLSILLSKIVRECALCRGRCHRDIRNLILASGAISCFG